MKMDVMKSAVKNMNVPNNQKVVFGIHQVTQPDLQVIMYVVLDTHMCEFEIHTYHSV